MVGEAGVREALVAAGVALTEDWQAADAVVVGLDREATYARLRDAALAIRRGARFIAANADRTLPTEQGLIPGAGSVVAFLEIATDVQAHVIGKPAPDIFLHALARLGTPASLTAAVGDRPETDIAGRPGGRPAHHRRAHRREPGRRRSPRWRHRRIGCSRIWWRCGGRISMRNE